MATKLSIYNDALQICGNRKLSGIDEARPARYKLDTCWDADLLNSVLEDTDWHCFIKTVQIEVDETEEPAFGHKHAFVLPDDLKRISGVYFDAETNRPLTDHKVEGGIIFANWNTIFVRYIPNNVIETIESWPGYFSRYVAGLLALQVAPDLKDGADRSDIQQEFFRREVKAKSADAQIAPTKRLPEGSWVQSRRGGSYRGRP